ncbi:MAG: Dihydrolipoyl dehydrogenase 3 [Alphaproteobacteria bacterium MarineAlpha10_Bin2]|nr:MAG: Dihydrolipoyl dehydrogenase 3 [Alphaproteobacteria bacterium MarineAlpha10_Bin2]
MNEKKFDVVVIGSGPGGYVAAIRAAQLGLKTACVEKDPALGGTCLNVGCIPSKALLQTSEEYAHAGKALKRHGVMIEGLSLDLEAMMGHKDKVVGDLTKGIAHLFKKNDITHLKGTGALGAAGEIIVRADDGSETKLAAGATIIATGSAPANLPGIDIDEKRILSSTGALALDEVPGHLAVIGAGYIGLEMASVWGRLGAKITVIEFLDRIVPGMDGELATQFQKMLRRQKMKFKLSTKVTAAEQNDSGVTLTMEPVAGGEPETLDADAVLVAVGRTPYTEGLGLDAAGVTIDNGGRIEIDEHFATNVAGVYAIGDVIAGPMLAHKAEDEGIAVAEIIAGQKGHVNYSAIPGVVYTQPELAAVGQTEEQLQEAGIDYTAGSFPFMANGRARAMSATDGFVKILADAQSDRILGVHIMGADAGTLIAEAVLAIELGASAEDLARTCHAHPTLSEAVKEAALDVDERAIHV